ncbi:MAG: heme ABC exporter ATP-binding protein CcmA [Endozoicomonadaceae bacterium]|nr:heme ABC exporter ATP-binding protein CcmA [Endozoicomonadaceae bacterium]
MLQLKQVQSERQGRVLFSNLSLNLPCGTLLRVIGSNGAGKTTLLKILAGIFELTQGSIACLPPLHANPLFIGHELAIKPTLTPLEYLQTWQILYNCQDISRLDQVCQLLELHELKSTPCSQLSAGQCQRIALAKLWLTSINFWVLDEPFTALDVNATHLIACKLIQHTQKNGLVIFTTHHLPEALEDKTQTLILNNPFPKDTE